MHWLRRSPHVYSMMSPRFDFGNLIKHAVIVGEMNFVYIYAAFQSVNVCEVSAMLNVVVENLLFEEKKKTPNVNRI